jgi:hypothetical protein
MAVVFWESFSLRGRGGRERRRVRGEGGESAQGIASGVRWARCRKCALGSRPHYVSPSPQSAPLSNAQAHARHLYAGLLAGARSSGSGGRGSGSGSGRSGSLWRGGRCCCCCGSGRGRGRRSGSGRGRCGLWRRCCGSGCACAWRRGRALGVDLGQGRAHCHSVAHGGQRLLQRARQRRAHVHRHLVRLNDQNNLIQGHIVPLLLQPLDQRALGDGVPHAGHLEHVRLAASAKGAARSRSSGKLQRARQGSQGRQRTRARGSHARRVYDAREHAGSYSTSCAQAAARPPNPNSIYSFCILALR